MLQWVQGLSLKRFGGEFEFKLSRFGFTFCVFQFVEILDPSFLDPALGYLRLLNGRTLAIKQVEQTCSQRLQYPLIKEYTLYHIRDSTMI